MIMPSGLCCRHCAVQAPAFAPDIQTLPSGFREKSRIGLVHPPEKNVYDYANVARGNRDRVVTTVDFDFHQTIFLHVEHASVEQSQNGNSKCQTPHLPPMPKADSTKQSQHFTELSSHSIHGGLQLEHSKS